METGLPLLVSETTRASSEVLIDVSRCPHCCSYIFRCLLCSCPLKGSEHMKSEKSVSEAIETYDHLLWEAVIRVCGRAFSKSFICKENLVRVVHQTVPPNYLSRKHNDPRWQLPKIEEVIEKFISQSLPIRKLGKSSRGTVESERMCSQRSYQVFLKNTISPSREYFEVYLLTGWREVYECDFVEIGNRGEESYICCPCVGEHLTNTQDLQGFEVNLQQPKRVGRDTYEFRFEVSQKTT